MSSHITYKHTALSLLVLFIASFAFDAFVWCTTALLAVLGRTLCKTKTHHIKNFSLKVQKQIHYMISAKHGLVICQFVYIAQLKLQFVQMNNITAGLQCIRFGNAQLTGTKKRLVNCIDCEIIHSFKRTPGKFPNILKQISTSAYHNSYWNWKYSASLNELLSPLSALETTS